MLNKTLPAENYVFTVKRMETGLACSELNIEDSFGACSDCLGSQSIE
jgi:hypothetical protein